VKLKFGLLWIEDEFSDQQRIEIENGASQAGFELEIFVSKDGLDLEELAKRQALYQSFDLILLDLNLGGGIKGDKLAPKVRSLFRSTPILFYSGSFELPELRDRMAKEGIEGVFCSHRRDFTRRASELISDYAPTLNRLSGMRGIAMEVVAEVDVICRKIIARIAVDQLAVVASESLTKDVLAQSNKNSNEFPHLPDLQTKLDHPATDSMKSFSAFRDVLKKYIAGLPSGEAKDQLSRLSLAIKDYRVKVLEVRNVLGHALEVKNHDGWLINDRSGKRYMTVTDFPNHRTTFIQHLNDMKSIARLLIPEE
jgi:CheY-like chemotaxis protein